MKALELTVYPMWDGGFGELYADKDDPQYPTRVDFEVYRKRLTDVELAAELFRQAAWLGAIGRTYRADAGRNIVIEAAFTFGPITRDEYEWLKLTHFAYLPHYDEAP